MNEGPDIFPGVKERNTRPLSILMGKMAPLVRDIQPELGYIWKTPKTLLSFLGGESHGKEGSTNDRVPWTFTLCPAGYVIVVILGWREFLFFKLFKLSKYSVSIHSFYCGKNLLIGNCIFIIVNYFWELFSIFCDSKIKSMFLFLEWESLWYLGDSYDVA